MPHLVYMFDNWWCFNSREEADRSRQGDTRVKAWHSFDPINAYKSWARFNRMKR